MKRIKLPIEVPPRSLPFYSLSYLCQQLSCSYLWRKFREEQKRIQELKCYCCGIRKKLELHEFIAVDDKRMIVKFSEPHFLCYACHSAKQLHYGTGINEGAGKRQLLKVNKWKEKDFKEYIEYIDRLVEKRRRKKYRIRFANIYKPLIGKMLEYLQGKFIKVHEYYVPRFEDTLNILKKAINRKKFDCFIIIDRTHKFFYKTLKDDETIHFQ